MHRRVGPYPRLNPREEVDDENWDKYFAEVGDYYDRVWLHLGIGLDRTKRVNRNRDEEASYWVMRPMASTKQKKYQNRLRPGWTHDMGSARGRILPLHEQNVDIGRKTTGHNWEKVGMRGGRYGAHLAPPRPRDFEYRVY